MVGAQIVTGVWCIFKTGGDFKPEHVARLAGQVARHGGGRLRCLTDDPRAVWATGADVYAYQTRDDWPGWFAKLELYSQPGPVLYLDLDTNVVGPLDDLLRVAAEHDLVVPRNWNPYSDKHVISTAVVGWRGDVSSIRDAFACDVTSYLDLYGDRRRWQEPGRGWGDQGFVRDHWKGERWAFWQDLLPGAMEHWKYGKPSNATALIVSGGRPRPWESDGVDAWLRSRGVEV